MIPPVCELVDMVPAGELERLARVDALLRATRSETHELKLTLRELSVIQRALQAAKTLGALPDGELLDDTIQLVDQALRPT